MLGLSQEDSLEPQQECDDLSKAETVGVECPECGRHIHLVIKPTKPRERPSVKHKIDNLAH